MCEASESRFRHASCLTLGAGGLRPVSGQNRDIQYSADGHPPAEGDSVMGCTSVDPWQVKLSTAWFTFLLSLFSQALSQPIALSVNWRKLLAKCPRYLGH